MSRTGQHGAVIAILIVCLAVTAFGAIGREARSPASAGDPVPLALLDAVEPVLADLTDRAGWYAAGGSPASREALQGALARFAEIRIQVEGMAPGTQRREEGQLLEAVRALVPRIHLLVLEIADTPTREKVALLGRLAVKTRAAVDQLRDGAAPRPVARSERIAGLVPRAADAVVPQGVVVLALTVACAVGMALFASTPTSDPLRRMLARASHRWHGTP